MPFFFSFFFLIFFYVINFDLNVITALFQKGSCFTIPHASLSHVDPAVRFCLPRQTDGQTRSQDGPGGNRLAPRPRSPPRGHLWRPGCVRFLFPDAGLLSDLGCTIIVVFPAVSFFACSYESCIIIIIIIIITSVSYVPPWCCARRTLSFGMIGIASGICSSFGCLICYYVLVFCLLLFC